MQRIIGWCRKKKFYMRTLFSCIFNKIGEPFSNEVRCIREEDRDKEKNTLESLHHQKLKDPKEEEKHSKENNFNVVNISENEEFDILTNRVDLSQSDIMKRYRLRNRISQGASSIVYQLECPSSHKFFAVKIQYVRIYDRKGVTRELNTLKNVENHPFHIQLKEFEYLANSRILLFVMECADCDLNTYIKKIKPLPRSRVRLYSQHLLDGISFLHEKMNVMHCDLKPQNLLICGEQLKIGDFGLCRPTSDTLESYLVTRWYRCPELLTCEKIFDERIDIWSIGCIIWEMTFSRPLFQGSTERDVMAKILLFFEKTSKFEKCSCEKINKIMTNSIVMDYKKRWSASRLLWILEMQPVQMKNEDSVSIDMNTVCFEETKNLIVCASDWILEKAV